MAFLQVGTVVVRATAFERLADEAGGEARRTLSGSLRGRPLWVARRWRGEVYCDTDAQANAVRAQASHSAAVSVSGDAIGTAVMARVEVTNDRYVRDGAGWYHEISLEIREAL